MKQCYVIVSRKGPPNQWAFVEICLCLASIAIERDCEARIKGLPYLNPKKMGHGDKSRAPGFTYIISLKGERHEEVIEHFANSLEGQYATLERGDDGKDKIGELHGKHVVFKKEPKMMANPFNFGPRFSFN
jgi:hypothetical protein